MPTNETCPTGYQSPRWSNEIMDCSMPMTFDTYSACSYQCQYCFAFFQKSIGGAKDAYLAGKVRSVSPELVKRHFTDPASSQFGPYIQRRYAMQWGGMSDPFDEHERRFGVSLNLLQFFRSLEYPICFSTKGTWWAEDERYACQFRQAKHFNVKVSIITGDEAKASIVERGVDSPLKRLRAIERVASWECGGATLRLRPFIIGVSTPSYKQLIRDAANAGATAVSMEFMCVERRTPQMAQRCAVMSEAAGIDLLDFYVKASPGSGYLRLNRGIKQPYVDEMEALCAEVGLRFYVSDAHFKERCHNGSCCGLGSEWNYARGQLCEALVYARKHGTVSFDFVRQRVDYLDFDWGAAVGFNCASSEKRSKFHDFSMLEYIRYCWNNVNGGNSPYKYTGGVLMPDGVDEHGDVVYRYNAQWEPTGTPFTAGE